MASLTKCVFFILLCHRIGALPVHSDLISSIQKVQQSHGADADNSIRVATEEETSTEGPAEHKPELPPIFPPRASSRQHKMLGFYSYIPTFTPIPAFYPTLPFPSTDIYGDYSNYGSYPGFGPTESPNSLEDDEDEAMSRANSKKRPSNQFKNSPIYYIRLPPTPYMFVPGLGYISQPPTYQPMAPVISPPPMSPFYNVPINFVSNGKPTGVYQWPMPAPPQNYYPTAPAQRPQRPYRPTYARPTAPSSNTNFVQPDSKITNLKGSYLFNGRPEEIYLLPQNPYTAGYYPDPYSYQNYQQGYSGYY